MKKLLYLLPLLLLVILSSCDTTDLQFDNHEYVLKYDNEQHYQECECGDIIDTQAHIFLEPIIRLEPTCTNTGIKEYKCTGCAFIKIEDIPALGHIEIIDKAIEVGCENEGLTEGSHCERCNKVLIKQETITSLGHDYSEFQISKEPTCEGEGLEKKVCNHCSNEVFNTIDATGHSYSDFTTTKEPKCEETGLQSRTCTCGHIDYQEIVPKGHTPVDGEALRSSCTEYGHTSPVLCDDCGITLTKEQLLPLLEHDYDDGVVIQEPKIKSYGIKEYTCLDCGNIKREKMDKLVVDTTLISNSISFDKDIVIDAKYNRNNYEMKYIKNDTIEYLYYVDRTPAEDIMKAYYKYEYNGIMMLYIHDLSTNTWTHEKYSNQTIFDDFKEFVYSKVALTTDNFDTVEFKNSNTRLINTITINGEEKNLDLTLNTDATLKSTSIYLLFEIYASYVDATVEIPNMGNIHTLPENNQCAECGMSCVTINNTLSTYAEEYYIYDDLSFAYSTIEYTEGSLPTYIKQEVELYKNWNDEYGIYKIKRYSSSNIKVYSFIIDNYKYNPETGRLELEYIDGDKKVDFETGVKLDNSMEFDSISSSPYYDYPDTHIGQTFEYRGNNKAYQFRFTETSMVVEVFTTKDLVYIEEDDTIFYNIQFGNPDDLFSSINTSYYINGNFASVKLTIDGINLTLVCESENINIEGTISDVRSYNHRELHYYVECDNGYEYIIYIENDTIKSITEYVLSV